MEAGRELDALVAERVMGLAVERIGDGWFQVAPAGVMPGSPYVLGDGREAFAVKCYSTDIAAAWRVVDHMRRRVPLFCALRMESAGVGYIAAFYSHDNPLSRPGAFAHGNTAPLAICFAALKAMGIEVGVDAE